MCWVSECRGSHTVRGLDLGLCEPPTTSLNPNIQPPRLLFSVSFMGYIRVHATLANPLKRDLKTKLEFIVDTGAIYTVIPNTIAKELQLPITDKRRFKIASGEIVEYPISEAYITLEDKAVTSLVAIATEKTPTLLGVTTLELLGLTVDPVTGKLTPLELMILQTL